MEEILRSTELTGVIGRNEMDKLASVYGSRWGSYRNKYEEASNLIIHDYPIQLDLELNSSCNLRCPMCPASVSVGKNVTMFPMDLYKKIIDYGVTRGLSAVKLNYVNEPLIRKDLFEFIEYAVQKGVVDVYLSTNGTLMNADVAHKLIMSGLTRIQVSIDATTDEVYRVMRPGGDYRKVLTNVDTLLMIRAQLQSLTPLIRVNFVRTNENEHQLDEFIAFWRHKVDMVGIQEFVMPTDGAMNLKSRTTTNKSITGFKCSFPFKQLVITSDRRVLPCCTFWGNKLSLGHLVEAEQITDFWHGDQMRLIRETHRNGLYQNIPQCKSCVEGGVL